MDMSKINNSDYESVLALLPMAVGWDEDKMNGILQRCKAENKILIAVYPGIPELMENINVNEMELVGAITDGTLYLK